MLDMLERHLPADGWKQTEVVDLGARTGRCEGCGRSVRYCRTLVNSAIPGRRLLAGAVCASVLTGNRKNEGLKEEKEGGKVMPDTRLQAKKRKFMESFKVVPGHEGRFVWEYGELEGQLRCVVRIGKNDMIRYWCGTWDREPDFSDMTKEPWPYRDQDEVVLASIAHAKEAAWVFMLKNWKTFGFDADEINGEPGLPDRIRRWREQDNARKQAEQDGQPARKEGEDSGSDAAAQKPSDVSGPVKEEKAPEAPVKERPVQAGEPKKPLMDRAQAMRMIAHMFPELGVNPDEAYRIGFCAPMASTPEGLRIMKESYPDMWKVFRNLQEGRDTDIRVRMLRLSAVLSR